MYDRYDIFGSSYRFERILLVIFSNFECAPFSGIGQRFKKNWHLPVSWRVTTFAQAVRERT